MKYKKYNSAIILPLKENFTTENFGAVSVWVNDYIKFSKRNNDLIFCKKKSKNQMYLKNNIYPISISGKIFTNLKYIKKISNIIAKSNISIVEIHNRPEYAFYLSKNNPNIKINLIFHNDPNTIRLSNKITDKEELISICNKIIFVSKWVKKRFFYNLENSHNNKTEIIYNFINPLKKFPKKNKIIIFSGKLNTNKGYNIFGKAIVQILNKFVDWKALVYGDEIRESLFFKHERLKINKWIDHNKLLKIYEKSSISVVNPNWEEPFGRTAMESASRGCAVITTKSGGLSETFYNSLILKKNDSSELVKLISKLILNKRLLLSIQKKNFKHVIHTPEKSLSLLNSIRKIQKIKLNINKIKTYKIIHISNFDIKTSHRLFNLSIAKKISNGLIRNGHDTIDFDYRNYTRNIFNRITVDKKVIEIANNYRPDLILLGHNNCLSRNTIVEIKKKYNTKFSIWYEDHVAKGDPNYKKNLDLLEKNNDLIDQYFITTSPDVIKSKISKSKINFLPIPVDPNIENGHFYESRKENDLFFALSNGVNYGKLKKNTHDERSFFINKLISLSSDKIKFNVLGLYGEQPKWNYDFYDELMLSKTALNLSRGGPNKYASSNRIATLMGNGVLTAIDEKVQYQDFFNNDEIIVYKNKLDLINQIISIKDNPKKIRLNSIKSKKAYFGYFENNIVADFLIHKIFNNKKKYNYVWSK